MAPLPGALSTGLLEDERIAIEGIVGTSAGAMNAVVDRLWADARRQRGGAATLCGDFWEAVAEMGTCSVMQPSWLDQLRSPGKPRLFARLDS